jgi:hypothetical protein
VKIVALRALGIVGAFAFAGVARADEPRPEDGVGTWRGKASWKGCAVAGAAQVAVDVTWKDGVFHVALGGARDDLGDVALVGKSDGSAAGTRDDLTVTFKPGTPGKLALATDGGCAATMTFARDGSGIAPCDRLLALSTIESSCATTPTSDANDLRGKLGAWKKLRGKAKATQADACGKDADALADALDQNGCFPKGGAVGGTGIAECDQYMQALQRFAQCNTVPVEAKQALQQAMSQMGNTWRSLSPEAKKAAADACKQGTDAIRSAAKAQGCPI